MKRWLMWIVVCLACVLPLAVAAQSGDQTLDLGDGIQMTVPADWEITEVPDVGITAGNGVLTVAVFLPAALAVLVEDFDGVTSPVEVLEAMLTLDTTGSLSADDIEVVEIGDRTAASFLDAANQQFVFTVPIGDSFGMLIFVADEVGVFTKEAALIEEIVASFDMADESEPASSGEACTVRVDTANSAALRVGPGENRSSIAFLPANADVTVTGRNELDDGSVWFQLDKDEAAPNGTAASELWVNADDVEASGECAAVGDASAPPVIPISVAPPPAPTAAPGEPAPEPVGAGALPRAGAWTVTLNATTNASCEGYENVPFSTAEVYTPTFFRRNISIVNANSFLLGSDRYTRSGSSNSFNGTVTFSDGTIGQVRFDVTSATSMSGQIVANYVVDGTACSDTVLFVATLG